MHAIISTAALLMIVAPVVFALNPGNAYQRS